ncbi:hypothetical protein WJX74_001182 [Apatococcus lobatus]|uniref:BP28 C-terminal domain-containing protein n=1 Tax=Apatococcus lobatus TaxID=904363 RepID=A0AAW1QVK9_9CHLO
MATALAEQLQQLSTRFGDASTGQRLGKASLLFNPREAAELDLESVFNIGISGFEELCSISSSYRPFANTLFGRVGLTYDVDQHTMEELERLDASLHTFLQLLSDHLLLNCAIQSLEYLVRRFRVHQRNVDALMACALPYHSTNEFVRLIQIMQIGGSQWAFLQPMQQSGAALPRGILVQRCRTDKAILQFICNLASQLAESGRRSPVQLSFYAVTVCEVLAFGPEVDADTINVLLPNIVQGLNTSASKDLQMATHMILAQLCSHAVLSSNLLRGVVPSLVQPGSTVGLRQRLMLVAHICATQPISDSLEIMIIQGLSKEQGLGELFASLSPRYPAVKALAARFLTEPISHSGAEPEEAANQFLQARLIHTAVHGSASAAGIPKSISKDLSSADPAVRVKAVGRLEEECKADASKILLRCLMDPNVDVLAAVLASPSTLQAPPEALFNALSSRLQAAWAQLSSGNKVTRKNAEAIAKKVLPYFGGEFLQSQKGFGQQVAHQVGDCLIALPGSTDRTAARALDVASDIVDPLFVGFASLKPAGKAGAKKRSAEECFEANSALVQVIVDGWAQQPGRATKQVKQCDGSGPNLKLLLLLALCQSIKHGKKGQQEVASGLFHLTLPLLKSTPSQPAPASSQQDSSTWFESHQPSAAFWQALATKPAEATRAAASYGLLIALQHARIAETLLSIGGGEGDAKQAFIALSQLQPMDAFQQHLLLFWSQACESDGQILVDILNNGNAKSQEQALRVLTAAAEGKAKINAGLSLHNRLLPACLTALSTASQAVRQQAVVFCSAAATSETSDYLSADDLISKGTFRDLMHAIVIHAAAIAADPAAAAALLRQAHAPSGKQKTASSARGLALSAAALADLTQYLLACLVSNGISSPGVASFICQSLPHSAPPASALRAARQVLEQLLATPSLPPGPSSQRLCQHIIDFYTPQAVHASTSSSEASMKAGAAMVPFIKACGLTNSAQSPAHWRTLHMAALKAATADLCASLPSDLSQELLMACLKACGSDQLPECKAAARSALEAVPILAQPLIAVLEAPSSLLSNDADLTAPSTASKRLKAASADAQGAVPHETLVAVLELLQWRHGIQDEPSLAKPLCSLLRKLLEVATADAGLAFEAAEPDDVDASRRSGRHAAEAAFLAQLVLAGLRALSDRADTQALVQGMDMGVIVHCTCLPNQPAAQQAALKLLTQLAAHLPHTSLAAIVEGVLGAATEHGGGAIESATAALAALGPTWLAAGQTTGSLLKLVTERLDAMQPLQRLPLLSATLKGLPQEAGLAAALHQLLAGKPDAKSLTKSPEKSSGQAPSWQESLAHAVCHQAQEPLRLRAFKAFMTQLSTSADPSVLMTTISFMLSQVKALRKLRLASPSIHAEEPLAAILQQALLHLQAVGTSSKKSAKRCRELLLELVAALQQVMPPGIYLASLIQLARTAPDRIACKALRLINSSLPQLSSSQVDGNGGRPDRQQAEQAVDQLCSLVQVSLGPGTEGERQPAATRQALLVTLGTLASTAGAQHAKPLLACIPTVLLLVQHEPRQAVRSSATASVAAFVTGLASSALPALPKLMPTLLDAAERSIQTLAAKWEEEQDMPDAVDSDEEDVGSRLPSEGAALEMASVLAAIAAASDTLGAYLSPYLSRLLALLPSAPLLACHTAGCRASAQAILSQLAAAIPARLLFGPLAAQLPASLQEGDASAIALLEMLQTATEGMPTAVAAEHADSIFELLRQALDCRQQQPAAVQDIGHIEQKAAQAFVSATLKLSEARFKPLFLRLLEWTSSKSQSDGPSQERQTALFCVVIALTRRLRAVFVPYFRYMMDSIVAHLGGSPAAGGDDEDKPKKKKKRQSLTSVAADVASPNGALLCFRMIAALRHCAQHDTVDFLDEARFTRLLPLLVSQLGGSNAPDGVSAAEAEAQDCAQDATEGDRTAGAAVEALIRMVSAVKDQALWQMFNRQVLMATRKGDSGQKARALQVIIGFLKRAQEEYLVLLPESLPFLAELLEVPDHSVSSLAQEILRQLEEISGESLDQYLA